MRVPGRAFPECQGGGRRDDQQVVQKQFVDGGLFLGQLAHHDGVDGQGEGRAEGGDDGPVEVHRSQDDDDAGKAAEHSSHTERSQFFAEEYGGQYHHQDGRGVEQGVGGGQWQVGQCHHHADDTDQMDVGADGVDFQAAEEVVAVEFAGEREQERQGEDAAQEGELEDGGTGVQELDEDV